MRRNGRQRSAWLHYALFWLTGGLFGPVWAYLMNRDIQRVEPTHFLGLKRFGVAMLIAFTLHVGFFFYFAVEFYAIREQFRSGTFEGDLGPPAGFPIAILNALFLVGCWVYVLFCAARFVRAARVPLPGNIALFFLLLVYGVSLPLVQIRLNRALANDA
jgi:hypothetical protein